MPPSTLEENHPPTLPTLMLTTTVTESMELTQKLIKPLKNYTALNLIIKELLLLEIQLVLTSLFHLNGLIQLSGIKEFSKDFSPSYLTSWISPTNQLDQVGSRKHSSIPNIWKTSRKIDVLEETTKISESMEPDHPMI